MDLLTEPIPRSDETVRSLAEPVEASERKTRRFVRIYMLVLVVFVFTLYLLRVDVMFPVGVAIIGALYPLLYFFIFVVGRGMGHAKTLARDGIAYPARVDEQTGGIHGGTVFWRVSWTDGAKREQSIDINKEKGRPRPGTDGVVLAVKGLPVMGVVTSDQLYVMGRRAE